MPIAHGVSLMDGLIESSIPENVRIRKEEVLVSVKAERAARLAKAPFRIATRCSPPLDPDAIAKWLNQKPSR